VPSAERELQAPSARELEATAGSSTTPGGDQ